MIEMIDPHLHFLLAHLDHVRPAKLPNDRILMQFAADCPKCRGSGKLSIALAKGGRILINCHSRSDPHGFRDCVPGTILRAIGLSKSVLFPPPVGNGQPPYEKRTKSQMIATWLRTALREPTRAADILKMFRRLASESLVQKVRTEIGVEMTKSGFPAVPYWLPVGTPVSVEPEHTVESPGPDNGEGQPIASIGTGSHRGGIDQLVRDVENQPMGSNGAGSRRGGTSAPEIVRDSASVDPHSAAELCAPLQRQNDRNPHVTATRTRGGSGGVGTRNSTTTSTCIMGDGSVEGSASEASPITEGEEGTDEHHAVPATGTVPGATFTVRTSVAIEARGHAPTGVGEVQCAECGGLEPEFHGYGRHRLFCSKWNMPA